MEAPNKYCDNCAAKYAAKYYDICGVFCSNCVKKECRDTIAFLKGQLDGSPEFSHEILRELGISLFRDALERFPERRHFYWHYPGADFDKYTLACVYEGFCNLDWASDYSTELYHQLCRNGYDIDGPELGPEYFGWFFDQLERYYNTSDLNERHQFVVDNVDYLLSSPAWQ